MNLYRGSIKKKLKEFDIEVMLHAAKDGDSERLLKCLNFPNSDINAVNKRGNTALHIAAIHGKDEICRILVDKGAKVNSTCKQGYTPLYVAVVENHIKVVDVLLSSGADKDITPDKNCPATKVAELQGLKEVSRLLNGVTSSQIMPLDIEEHG